MYLGPPCYGYAINCHLFFLAIPGTRLLCMKKQNLFILIISTAKSEIQICSNKHETCLVVKYEINAVVCVLIVDTNPLYFHSKKGGKDQELIQSNTTPDPGYHMGK